MSLTARPTCSATCGATTGRTPARRWASSSCRTAWRSRSRLSSRSRISEVHGRGEPSHLASVRGALTAAPGRPRLVAAIRAAIRAQGPITFVAFMDLALYHPRYGYYTALRAPPGPRGDYYTSPETHPAFGALVARQLQEVWERLGHPRLFVVEEWGAGSGRLAADILAAAPALLPAFEASLAYTIVERSPALRRAQQRLLAPWAERVRWLDVAAENLERASTSSGAQPDRSSTPFQTAPPPS